MLRVLRCRKEGISDFVPVDLLNNVIISAGWLTGVTNPAQPLIFQYTSGTKNPINWIELCMCVHTCMCLTYVCVCVCETDLATPTQCVENHYLFTCALT